MFTQKLSRFQSSRDLSPNFTQSQTPLRSDNSAVGGRTMRLNVTSTSNVHKELVACVGWNAFNELYSVGDDKTVSRWDINGDAGGKVRTDRCDEIFIRPTSSNAHHGPDPDIQLTLTKSPPVGVRP